MQETTFNSPCHSNGTRAFDSVNDWLVTFFNQEVKNKVDLPHSGSTHSLFSVQQKINYKFENESILRQAFTHSTFSHEFHELQIPSNERLEFLGDSILNMIVAKEIYQLFPELSEGELSKIRGALVNESSLAKLAESIELGSNLFLGKGEFKSHGEKKSSLLADSLEALIAAVFIDSNENLNRVSQVFAQIIKTYEIKQKTSFYQVEALENFDSKSKLQEVVMALYQVHPEYRSVELKNEFSVELWIGEKMCAAMTGPSKKKIEKELARLVLLEKRYQL